MSVPQFAGPLDKNPAPQPTSKFVIELFTGESVFEWGGVGEQTRGGRPFVGRPEKHLVCLISVANECCTNLNLMWHSADKKFGGFIPRLLSPGDMSKVVHCVA